MSCKRIVIGVDPGVTGAIAIIGDAQFRAFHDLPTRTTRNGKQEIDGGALADIIEKAITNNPDASFFAAVEQVSAMPPKAGPGGVQRSMGTTSAFRFGEGFGMIRGVLESMRVPYSTVVPQSWKAVLSMTGSEKDYARTKAGMLYPAAVPYLQRKKDIGRADAILLAHWGWLKHAQQMEAAALTLLDKPF